MKKIDNPQFPVECYNQMAEDISDYLDALLYVFHIPKQKRNDKKFKKKQEFYQEEIKTLIKKLRKGDTSVSKDPDEVDSNAWLQGYLE